MTYDLVAIGAGPAGESATELASFFGLRCAVVEKNRPGGTVTTTGGAPTKTLREAALFVSGLRDGDAYGVRATVPAEVAIDVVRTRTLDVCTLLQDLTKANIASRNVDYIEGAARLGGDGVVHVAHERDGATTLHAKTILIATGSRPRRPDGAAFRLDGVVDTDTILYRGRGAPKQMVIVGGGAVAIEFATICRALGSKVTILDRGRRLASVMDREIADRLAALFGEWGVDVKFECTVDDVTRAGDALDVTLSTRERLRADTLLIAAGRVANTEGLGLDEAGVRVDERGRVVVDEQFRTSAAGVYAAGDVLEPTLASIAMEQGRAAVCAAFGFPFEGNVDPTPVSAIYGMPELSGTGLTEEQARERGLQFEVGRADLALTPRGAIAGRGGLLKLIFQKGDRKLVGVHCIGDIASEIVGIGQMAIRCGGTLNTLATMSFNTPTYSYAYKYAALDGLRRLAHPSNAGNGA
ncbi:MAG TPA: FAD-dependent oxidoreductase [Candidatus Acidoferrales bacterium]|jgi:NAD(P) transhydrogenase|nr:FAD-dependent oxidoreductase [Candidatus Acidoferrales bacterium]